MKRLCVLLAVVLFPVVLFGQAKKPTLMVVPSDAWCKSNNYVTEIDNQGTNVVIPDYKRALLSDMNLGLVIAKINTIMSDRGFPLKNLESVIKSIEQRTAEDNMTASKTSGTVIAENSLDKLRRTAKADIILQLGWKVNVAGPKKSITYILQGIDAYTDKQIAGSEGTGNPSLLAELPLLLEEAVVVNMDNFVARLQDYFNDLLTNGREVAVDIKVFDNSSGLDMESEYDGMELSEIIDNWVNQNTVEHRYSKSDASENYIYFEQVRIPLYNAAGKAMDTESFVRELRKYLRDTYKIDSKVMTKGLGRAVLVLGEK